MKPVSPFTRTLLIVVLVALAFGLGYTARLTLLESAASRTVSHPMLVAPSIVTPVVRLTELAR